MDGKVFGVVSGTVPGVVVEPGSGEPGTVSGVVAEPGFGAAVCGVGAAVSGFGVAVFGTGAAVPPFGVAVVSGVVDGIVPGVVVPCVEEPVGGVTDVEDPVWPEVLDPAVPFGEVAAPVCPDAEPDVPACPDPDPAAVPAWSAAISTVPRRIAAFGPLAPFLLETQVLDNFVTPVT